MTSRSFHLSSTALYSALAAQNMAVNPACDVSQENGTTQLTLVTNTDTHVIDCWRASYKCGTGVVKARQLVAASFPAVLPGFANALEIIATTAMASLANGDYAKHMHLVEGYRVAKLGWGATGALPLAYGFSYYNPTGGAATIFLKFSNSDYSRCYYVEKAVAAGWNWISGYIPGDTSGTWQKTTSTGLYIEVFSAGKAASPVATTNGEATWSSTNTTQTTNSTQNLLSTNNYNAVVTGLILLAGQEPPADAVEAAAMMRSFDQELLLCQRYWEKSYDYATALGTATAVGTSGIDLRMSSATITSCAFVIPFKVQKRATPTVTGYSTNTGTSGKFFDGVNAADVTATPQWQGLNHIGISASLSVATNICQLVGHWKADARLT